MRRRMKVNYLAGSCFLVPLRNGGYARGVVARLNGKGLVFGYFFGPRLASPEDASACGLRPDQAVLIGKFGDLSLTSGAWKSLGLVEAWTPKEWPMPPLVRVDEATGQATLSFYDERTFECIKEEVAPSGSQDRYPYDRTMGAGAVEIRLSKLLSGG